MSLLVVGSVAFDAIKTPYGKVDRILGGAATYFSLAASFFTDVRVVAVVGEDFTAKEEQVFHARKIDVSGIVREAGKSFFWAGEYGENVNEAKTLDTQLGVFGNFNPQVPQQHRGSEYVFLANIDPALQVNVRRQVNGARFVGGDTMNFWINGKADDLAIMLKSVDALLINDTEAKMLAKDPSLPRAAQAILKMGPKALVIKHGEYGATVFFQEGAFGIGRHPFRAPTLPIEVVTDPTGAGDSFAGGFMGYIASQEKLTRDVFKRAMFYGGVMGSFAVEAFGTERLQKLTRPEIEDRYKTFIELTHIE
ncbi:MAG TPA: PfkB family carbohydrate kinase [Candidatus Saccharimonadales bacterium]|nr:PfkB family carbohydrate kinase [Candidatus Saccharimonadales bacterium]